jgi:hypothetical protein
MMDTFARFIRDKEPYTLEFHTRAKPAGMVVVRLRIDHAMPELMSLIGGDVIHNNRVALDHTLARLKEHFGGNPGRGSFPICKTAQDWQSRVVDAGRNSPLRGLEGTSAFDLIHGHQPLHRADPEEDPLVVLNALDNDDKHRLLHVPFIYPGMDEGEGLDLIEITDPKRVVSKTTQWKAGEPLEHGTVLATFLVRGAGQAPLQASRDAQIGFAIGELGRGRVSFADMVERVRDIVTDAELAIDAAKPQT